MKKQKETWIDNSFRVQKFRWGTWSSFDKDGKQLVSSLTEEVCIEATRFYLKGLQEGFPEDARSYTGKVDGKL